MWSGSPSHLTAFLSFSVLLVLVRVVLTRRVTRIPLPPGPKTSWFGQVDLPKAYQWRTYADWKHIYGKVYHYALRIPPNARFRRVQATSST